jgi:D-alanyl-D-alanine carboxypeptidase (penicillin-binding protein 5/6)
MSHDRRTPRRIALLLASGFAATMLLHAALLGAAPDTERTASYSVPGCEAGRPLPNTPLAASVPVRRFDASPPAIGARTAVVIDADSGRVLWNQRAHARRAPASTTKIMTAILALEASTGDERVVSAIDATEMVGSSVMGLRPGLELSVRDLLYGLMLPSGNDAAVELAHFVAGSERAFVDRMNAKVDELGLVDTHFANPHGLDDPRHYSSAYDLAMMARYAMRSPAFRDLAAAQLYHLQPPADYDLQNGNSLLYTYEGADGVKIGWTGDAGWTFVASAQREGRRIIVALLDTPDRDADAAALLDWAFWSHTWIDVTPAMIRSLESVEKFGMGSGMRRLLLACS